MGLRAPLRDLGRTKRAPSWLNHYNFIPPHGSLAHKPPGSRLNNPRGNYI